MFIPDTHETILVFEETEKASFPLLLVIGRAPNTEIPIENKSGNYDFRESPNCAFWNTSYSVLATIIGQTTVQLKNQCAKKHASPIIYADAFPIGLPLNPTRKEKNKILSAISDQAIEEHISNIFAYTHLIDRVQLVILSGLQKPHFDRANPYIHEQCQHYHKPLKRVPLFYGTNAKIIREELEKERQMICDVMHIFEQYSNPH